MEGCLEIRFSATYGAVYTNLGAGSALMVQKQEEDWNGTGLLRMYSGTWHRAPGTHFIPTD